MPELPEVEIARQNLARWTAGRRLSWVEVTDPLLLRDAGGPPPEALVGATLAEPVRRGKHLLLPSPAGELLLHFRMTGKLVPDRPGGRTRLRLGLDDGRVLAFKDSRRLGEARVFAPGGASAWLAGVGLGDEPWPDRHPGAWWSARLGDLAAPLKPAMMRQDRVAGLGNIAAAEICWRARLDPRAPARAVDAAGWERLAEAAWRFLHETIAAEQGDEVHYLNDGREADNPFAVYLRHGEPCPRCGAAVARFEQAGRGTWWCPPCQARTGSPAV